MQLVRCVRSRGTVEDQGEEACVMAVVVVAAHHVVHSTQTTAASRATSVVTIPTTAHVLVELATLVAEGTRVCFDARCTLCNVVFCSLISSNRCLLHLTVIVQLK